MVTLKGKTLEFRYLEIFCVKEVCYNVAIYLLLSCLNMASPCRYQEVELMKILLCECLSLQYELIPPILMMVLRTVDILWVLLEGVKRLYVKII